MVKKDRLKSLTGHDFICSLLLLKPQSKEGSGRFDARRLYDVLREEPHAYPNHQTLEDVMPHLRMGHTIYQHSDEMHTQIYYIREAACKAIRRDLEIRLGPNHLQNFRAIAKKIWEHYDALAPVGR